LEVAKKYPPTLEALTSQLDRLGDTPFCFGRLNIDQLDSVMIPRSVLNDLRREAVAQLIDARLRAHRRTIEQPDALSTFRQTILSNAQGDRESGNDLFDTLAIGGKKAENRGGVTPRMTVLVRNFEQLHVVLQWKSPSTGLRPAMVYCDFEDPRRYREAVPRAKAAGVPIGLATLRVLKPGEDGFLKPILHTQPDAVLIRNLGTLLIFREEASKLPEAERPGLIGDFSLNVVNELTADLFRREGLSRLVPGYDLNWDQLISMIGQIDPMLFEVVIHQHMPMFHMEHCVFAAFLSTGKDFRDCGRPCDRHRVELRDRMDAEFPVIPDAGCRNTVFNSVAQSAAEYVGRMIDLGLRWFRLELLRENAEDVPPLLERYARVLTGLDDGHKTWRQLQVLNQLGVTRGTLQT
jgi:putative protease